MLRKIYRKEAIEYKKHHWKGKALLLAGLPAWLIALLSFAFLAILITTTIFCTFTQRIDVRGKLLLYLILSMFMRHSKGLLFPNMQKSVTLSPKDSLYMKLTSPEIQQQATSVRRK